LSGSLQLVRVVVVVDQRQQRQQLGLVVVEAAE